MQISKQPVATSNETDQPKSIVENQRSNPIAVPRRQVPGRHSKDPRVTYSAVEPRMKQQTKSEPNKQLAFPVEPCEPIRVADGKKKEVLYVIQA